jgi:hypothetical protein
VFFDQFAYVVINATTANDYIDPGTIPNAWNRVGTLYYQENNTYFTDDIAIYLNTAYIAIQTSTGIFPGDLGSESYWILYTND